MCNIFSTIVGSLWHEGPLYFFMAIILIFGRLFLHTSWVGLALMLLFASVMGIIGNAFHMSFHVRGFELECYQWYMELRMLHYIHHLGDMKSNLAMVNLGMDGFFSSLMVDDPSRHRKNKDGSRKKHTSELGPDDFPAGLNAEMF